MTSPRVKADDTNAEVVLRTSPGLVEVWFNRPDRHNAFTAATYRILLDLCADLHTTPEVRVVVFRGTGGRAFSAGNEIAEFLALADGAAGVAYEAEIGRVLRALTEVPQVTVAAIEGLCVGGGLAVATHCDLRLCTEGSRFGYPIARTLGNALSASAVYRCTAVFGESLTREMLLLSRLIDADRTYAVGGVLAVVPPERLDGELAEIVAGLCRAAPETLAATKEQLLHRSRRLEMAPEDDAERLERVYGGANFRSGVRAFLTKQQPRFR